MINEFEYGQTWKIWPSPLSLLLYSTFKYFKNFSFTIYKGKFGASKNEISSENSISMVKDAL